MAYPFHVLIIVGKPSIDRSWLVQRLADSREGAIVFTPSYEGYSDYCQADGYSMVIIDDLMLFNPEVARETVLRLESQAIAMGTRMAFVVSDMRDLADLDIELVSEPMILHLLEDRMISLNFCNTHETWHMDDVHKTLARSEPPPQKLKVI